MRKYGLGVYKLLKKSLYYLAKIFPVYDKDAKPDSS